MKRFHVHLSVDDLQANIRFYSTVFETPPAVVEADYAKWMLDDPRINFAISTRGASAGLNHLGLQVDSDEELAAMRRGIAAASVAALDQPQAACCYAKSDKYWIEDPQGIAWETFHTLERIPVFGADTATAPDAASAACCAPAAVDPEPAFAAPSACCAPAAERKARCC
jgi:catechol 2,3-dioxygenase-like lactoylglutathione lyase family enzyme